MSYIPGINKIDAEAVDGLTGVSNSLAYKVHEIEKHLHSRERWLGKLSVQTATDWADDTLSPFQAISGNNTYGADVNDEALVLGSDDTPVISGMVKYNIHKLFITAASSTTAYKLRIVYGSGTIGDAITAKQFTEVIIKIDASAGATPAEPIIIQCPRLTCGIDKVWIQAWNATDNATIDFLVGLHEYEG